MFVINVEVEVSGHGAWVRFMISCSVRSTGMLGLPLQFGSGSDLRSVAY